MAKFGYQAKQKWINDIFVDDKKVGGILCECTNSVSSGGYELSIGIGVNLKTCPPDCAHLPDIDRSDLLSSLASKLLENVRKADSSEESIAELLGMIDFQYINEHV